MGSPKSESARQSGGGEWQQASLFEPEKAAVPAEVKRASGGPCGVARVQLEGSATLELDYAIPEALLGKLAIGSRVLVPLQKQHVQAVVIAMLESSPHGNRLRELLKLIGSRPMFTPGMLKLAS